MIPREGVESIQRIGKLLIHLSVIPREGVERPSFPDSSFSTYGLVIPREGVERTSLILVRRELERVIPREGVERIPLVLRSARNKMTM